VSGRLLTARELGEAIGVSAETVLRWTRQGELPAIRLPGTARGRLRYRPEDVDAWLEQHGTGAASRGASPTQDGRAQVGGYASLLFPVSPTPPPDAATTEEE
jgi:excisionase family DNA binding protein